MERSAEQQIVVEAAAALTHAELASGALRTTARALDAPIGLLYETPGPNELFGYLVDGPTDLFCRYSRFAASDPLRAVKTRLNPRLAVTSNLVEKSRLQRTEVYGELYAPIGAEHHLVLRLSAAGYGESGLGAVVFSRRRGWSREDGARLGRLLPSLSSALERARRFAAVARRGDVLEELILAGRAQHAFGAWDLEGRALWLSAQAEGDRGLADLSGCEAPQPLASRWRAVALALRRGETTSIDTRVEVATGAGLVRGDLWLCATPRRGAPFVALLTARRELHEKVARAAELFGLSTGERRVLLALADGRSNAELSRDLFVSIDTVRTHVQRILRKMRCASRLRAVTTLMQL